MPGLACGSHCPGDSIAQSTIRGRLQDLRAEMSLEKLPQGRDMCGETAVLGSGLQAVALAPEMGMYVEQPWNPLVFGRVQDGYETKILQPHLLWSLA